MRCQGRECSPSFGSKNAEPAGVRCTDRRSFPRRRSPRSKPRRNTAAPSNRHQAIRKQLCAMLARTSGGTRVEDS